MITVSRAGFIILPRDEFNHPFFEDFWNRAAWMELLTHARGVPTVDIQRGQFRASYREISRWLRCAENRARRFVGKLIELGKLTVDAIGSRCAPAVYRILDFSRYNGEKAKSAKTPTKARVDIIRDTIGDIQKSLNLDAEKTQPATITDTISDTPSYKEERTEENVKRGEPPPEQHGGGGGPRPQDLFDLYLAHCGGLPKPKKFTLERERHAKMRLAHARDDPGEFLKQFTGAIQRAACLPFCLGEGPRGWMADFDFFIANDTNYLKVLEGKYDRMRGRYGESEAEAKSRRIDENFDSFTAKVSDCLRRGDVRAADRELLSGSCGPPAIEIDAGI